MADGEWNDLDGRHHLPLANRRVRRQGPYGDGLVDMVQAVDHATIDHDDARVLGMQIAAAGMGDSHSKMGAGQHVRDGSCRQVFIQVVGRQARPGNRGDIGFAQQFEIGGGETAAFLERGCRQLEGVRQQDAFRLIAGKITKNHVAAICLIWIDCARTAAAISARQCL